MLNPIYTYDIVHAKQNTTNLRLGGVDSPKFAGDEVDAEFGVTLFLYPVTMSRNNKLSDSDNLSTEKELTTLEWMRATALRSADRARRREEAKAKKNPQQYKSGAAGVSYMVLAIGNTKANAIPLAIFNPSNEGFFYSLIKSYEKSLDDSATNPKEPSRKFQDDVRYQN